MGRRPDDPIEQAAKGYPGRRRKRVIAAAEAAAERIAAEAGTDPLALPEMFARAPARWRRAVQIWNAQVQTLRSIGRSQPAYRYALARYCIWSQVFEFAADQLARDCPKGDYVIDYKTGHDATKKVEHPALKIMSDAEPVIRALDQEFGFTPRADVDMTRVESFNARQGSFNFPTARPAQTSGEPDHETTNPIALMSDADSPVPGQIN